MIVILWLVHANLWVTSAAPSVNNVEVGRNVTLVPQYSGDPSEINWKIDGNKLVDMELKPRVDIVFYRLQGRATISPTDGSLTIWDLTIGDSGVYKAEALVNNVIQETEIKLIVSDPAVTAIYNRPGSPSTKTNDQPKAEEGQSGLSASHMTAIVIGGIALVVVAIVGTVIYKKCRRRRSAPNVIIIQKRSDGTAYVRSGEKEKTAMFTKTPGGS